MPSYALTDNFNYFFGQLNPSPTFRSRASKLYDSVKGLIEDRSGLARELSPSCFLQGSYRNETAAYTINDVDIVALCELWDPIPPNWFYTHNYSRDEIFDIVAAPLLNDWRYRDKVSYTNKSMCIKLDTEPRIEILPAVYKCGNRDFDKEPFRLYRPENRQWEDGFARYHKRWLSCKNNLVNARENFVPTIKVFKHLRTKYSLNVVSFHLECLLFSLPDRLFVGSPADYIPGTLEHIASTPASSWYGRVLKTPCEDRDIFVSTEWERQDWEKFHKAAVGWAKVAHLANQAEDRDTAISYWQALLGSASFPRTVSP